MASQQQTEKPKKVNLLDHYSLKRALDDTATEVILSKGYTENVTLSNIKMGIGVLTCLLAVTAQFYPKKFPASKDIIVLCIIIYVVLNAALQYVIFGKEKNHILFTKPLQGSFSSTGLAVSSTFPRYLDMYTLEIASADPKSIAAHPPAKLTKSATKWFTKDGHLVESIFREEVEALLGEYLKESRKTK